MLDTIGTNLFLSDSDAQMNEQRYIHSEIYLQEYLFTLTDCYLYNFTIQSVLPVVFFICLVK